MSLKECKIIKSSFIQNQRRQVVRQSKENTAGRTNLELAGQSE